ncbi:MBL fold metallo-hydrolase [Salinibacter ruber]|uniref:MBL fold metallo-hydrolase n=1 Tax=Salinibacter ruber TaxID=146919 RepID=UPI0021D0F7F0|nr:MBL fold metallo-hydrolase [Salinibacter ruber]
MHFSANAALPSPPLRPSRPSPLGSPPRTASRPSGAASGPLPSAGAPSGGSPPTTASQSSTRSPPAPDCWNGLRERSDSPLAMVINTHHHGDHVGGNGVFARHTDRLVAHANVPELMRAGAEDGAADEKTYPTETFQDTWSEPLGDETITLRYRGPAHTGGDAIVVFENANIVHVGDLVFNRAYPFIDVGGGADSQGWIDSLETIHGALDDDTIVIHGHGNPDFGVTGGREDLLVVRDFLSALNEYVTQQRQAGASLDEMKQTKVLDGFEAFNFDWALSLADCIEAVYREQTAR